MANSPRIRIDRRWGSAYLRFSDAPVERTLPALRGGGLDVDIDAAGNVVGIEILLSLSDEVLDALERTSNADTSGTPPAR